MLRLVLHTIFLKISWRGNNVKKIDPGRKYLAPSHGLKDTIKYESDVVVSNDKGSSKKA
jgi:hypothetical protein